MALLHMLLGQSKVYMPSDLSPLVILNAVPSPLLLYGIDLEFKADSELFHQVLRSREAIFGSMTSYPAILSKII